jgi:glutathione S-transferase
MLTIHHLGRSQSERIVWLCEELGVPYELKRYDRRADNRLAPPEYKALHPMGIAPVISDGDLVLGESGAVVEYIVQTYGGGRLVLKHGDAGFADFLYWFHFANGTLQPTVGRMMFLERADPSGTSPALQAAKERLALVF